MKIISVKTLRDFWAKNPDAEQPLKCWNLSQLNNKAHFSVGFAINNYLLFRTSSPGLTVPGIPNNYTLLTPLFTYSTNIFSACAGGVPVMIRASMNACFFSAN